MTGGKVVVLGPTGRNFAAGMSGGLAYVLDENGTFADRCNKEMVYLETLMDEDEINELEHIVRKHADYTDSNRAWKILAKWKEVVPQFVKVYPKDFKRMRASIDSAMKLGLEKEAAELQAFYQNKGEKARVAGN
jgi:glutamate synthase (ferredoxin)